MRRSLLKYLVNIYCNDVLSLNLNLPLSTAVSKTEELEDMVGKNILVVDQPLIRNFDVKLLRNAGYLIEEAASGEESHG